MFSVVFAKVADLTLLMWTIGVNALSLPVLVTESYDHVFLPCMPKLLLTKQVDNGTVLDTAKNGCQLS